MTLPEARRVFGALMKKARMGHLTERDRLQLTQARQLLRRSKRPAMNPVARKDRFSLYVQDTTGQSTFRGEFFSLPKAKKAALSFARSASYPLVEIYGQGGRIVWSSRGRLAKNPSRRRRRLDPVGERQRRGMALNPSRMVRIGRALEVRYKRDIGRKPGYYKHEIRSRKAGVYTIPPGWVYVSSKSVLITEGEPRV